MCPGSCHKRLMPAIVKSSMRHLCGLCGRNFDKKQKSVVSCCESHEFCIECLADHVKGSIRLKIRSVTVQSHIVLLIQNVYYIIKICSCLSCFHTCVCASCVCSPMCPRSSECHYTLAVPEVRRILEHSARIGGTSNLAFAAVRLMKT